MTTGGRLGRLLGAVRAWARRAAYQMTRAHRAHPKKGLPRGPQAVPDWLEALSKEHRPGGRHSPYYENYMQSPAWHLRRERTLVLAGRTCQRCGCRRATDAHHVSYERLGAEWDSDLLAVCAACHRLADAERVRGAA